MRRGRSTFNPHVSPMWGFEEEFLESDVMRRHGCFGGDGGVSAGTLQADVHRSNVEGGYGPVTEYDAEGWGYQDLTATPSSVADFFGGRDVDASNFTDYDGFGYVQSGLLPGSGDPISGDAASADWGDPLTFQSALGDRSGDVVYDALTPEIVNRAIDFHANPLSGGRLPGNAAFNPDAHIPFVSSKHDYVAAPQTPSAITVTSPNLVSKAASHFSPIPYANFIGLGGLLLKGASQLAKLDSSEQARLALDYGSLLNVPSSYFIDHEGRDVSNAPLFNAAVQSLPAYPTDYGVTRSYHVSPAEEALLGVTYGRPEFTSLSRGLNTAGNVLGYVANPLGKLGSEVVKSILGPENILTGQDLFTIPNMPFTAKVGLPLPFSDGGLAQGPLLGGIGSLGYGVR